MANASAPSQPPASPPVPSAERASAAPMEQPPPSPAREAALQAAAALPDKETKAGPAAKQAAAALPGAEVREIQTLLQGFGFDPGPIDGAAGAKTQEAARRYRQSRGGDDTGAIDRRLLDALRHDPAPSAKTANVAATGALLCDLLMNHVALRTTPGVVRRPCPLPSAATVVRPGDESSVAAEQATTVRAARAAGTKAVIEVRMGARTSKRRAGADGGECAEK